MKQVMIVLTGLWFAVGSVQGATEDTVTYYVDTSKSYIYWHCDSHYGTVPLLEGVVQVSGNKISGGDFVILMDSLKDTDIDYELMRKTLINTLTSEFFFDTGKYPYASFVIDYVEKTGKKQMITGDLIIKDIAHCITFPAKVGMKGTLFTAVTDTFQINRLNWGITIYSQQEAVSEESVIISDNIDFVIHLVAKREE